MKTKTNAETLKVASNGFETLFILTAADTGGAYTEAILFLPAGVAGDQHIHPYQDEYFEAMEGRLGLMIGNRVIFLQPGESYTVKAGVPHVPFAPNGAAVKCRSIWKRSLHIEYLFREYFGAANRNRSKKTSVLERAYIVDQMKGEFEWADIPKWVHKVIFPVIGFIGKVLGLVNAKKLY